MKYIITLIIIITLLSFSSTATEITGSVTVLPANVTPTPASTYTHTSSSSSSTGGFGVISNEPFLNIDIAESIIRDLHINLTTVYNFKKTSIYEIIISPTRNENEVMIRVENLKGISTTVDTAPSGEVFKYTNIYFGSNYIKQATVRFKLDSSLISNKNINLQYWNGKAWELLPTTLIGTDDNYYYYETIITGLSRFSIVGVSTEPVPTPTPEVVLEVKPTTTQLTPAMQLPITIKSPGFDIIIAFISMIVISAIRKKL